MKHRTNIRLDDQAKEDAAFVAEELALGSTSAAVRYALRELAKRIKKRKLRSSPAAAPKEKGQ
jgi:Arc/MetJ family transcription regulator